MKPLLVASIATPAPCAFCTRPAAFVWAVIGRHSFPVCTTDQKRLSRWAELRSAALGSVGTAEEAAAAFPDLLELSAQLWDDLVAAFTREECGAPHPYAGEPCTRQAGHPGGHGHTEHPPSCQSSQSWTGAGRRSAAGTLQALSLCCRHGRPCAGCRP